MGAAKAAATRIYARHNLGPKAGRQALAQKLGLDLPGRQALSAEFRHRLLAEQSNQEIMGAMRLTHLKVLKRCANLYRKEGVKGRKGLFNKHLRGQNRVGLVSTVVDGPDRTQ